MSDLEYDITSALNSGVYSPQNDETTISIYNLVSTSDIDDETYAYYKNMFDNLSTVNPYSAAVQNPNKGYICDSQDSITKIIGNNSNYDYSGSGDTNKNQNINYDPSTSGSLGLQYHNVKLAGTPVPDSSGNTGINPNNNTTTDGDISKPDQNGVYPGNTGYQPTQNQIDILNNWNNSYISTVSSIAQFNSGVSDYEDHTDKLLANLPMILGIVQSALGLANILGNLANPCLGIENFLGSLTKKGKSLIQKIRDGIKKIEQYIGAALSVIQKAIADVMAFVNKLINLVENEISNLIKALINGLQYGLASLLKSLVGDPCMKSLLGILGTPSLTSII